MFIDAASSDDISASLTVFTIFPCSSWIWGLTLPFRRDLSYPIRAMATIHLCLKTKLQLHFVFCKKSLSCVELFVTPGTVAHQAPRPYDSLGKNTGVGSHSRLQEIFPTQGLNLSLPLCRQSLYHLSHQGRPFYVLLTLCF